MSANTILFLILTGIVAGVLSGLVGVGGGVVMVPMLVWIGFSQHQAQGTSLAVLSVPVTLLAATTYYKEGYLNWKYALIIAVFFVIGGFLGSKLAVGMDQKMIKKIFGVILLFVAGKMIFGK
ncbi:MAG: TSUP family transporter [Flavobacterium sp.]